jgi:hypothetical protein
VIALEIADNVVDKALQSSRDSIRTRADGVERITFNVLHSQILWVILMRLEPMCQAVIAGVWVLAALRDGVKGCVKNMSVRQNVQSCD